MFRMLHFKDGTLIKVKMLCYLTISQVSGFFSTGEFETVSGRTIGFDIQDVSGGYVYEFPSMMTVSLTSADAFVLVFSIDSNGSWEEVARLRDIIQTSKGNQVIAR